MLETLTDMLNSTNEVLGFFAISVTKKIRIKEIRTHTKGYMLLVMKNIVAKYVKNVSDSAHRD